MSLRTVGRVAAAVFRESVRDRVLYSVVAFAALVTGSSLLISQLTAGQDVKIIKDLGLAAMSLFGAFIAIFIGIGLVAKEVERKSVYSLLAKPVRRSELVIGKYAGLVLTLAINLAVMTLVWYGVLRVLRVHRRGAGAEVMGSPGPRSAHAAGGVSDLRAADAGHGDRRVLLHGFSTSSISRHSSRSGVSGGRSIQRRPPQRQSVVSSPIVGIITRALYYVLPNMAAFDVKAAVVHGRPVGSVVLAAATGYGLLYVAALLLASVVIFTRRDFK